MLKAHDEAGRIIRLIGRYRDLLAEAEDDLLRRGIERELESLEARLRRLDARRRQNIPSLIAGRSDRFGFEPD